MVTGLYEDVTAAVDALDQNIAGNLKGLGCPLLEEVNADMYTVYPGFEKAKGY